jgi:hypothetical protein
MDLREALTTAVASNGNACAHDDRHVGQNGRYSASGGVVFGACGRAAGGSFRPV